MKYVAQKGDLCRWSHRGLAYVQEYDGKQWSHPISLRDLSSANPKQYAHVTQPEWEIVHSKKNRQVLYYRQKYTRGA